MVEARLERVEEEEVMVALSSAAQTQCDSSLSWDVAEVGEGNSTDSVQILSTPPPAPFEEEGKKGAEKKKSQSAG